MRADDLDLNELLDLEPEQGVVRLAGERALILDAVALGLLRKELIDALGTSAARSILTRFGFAHGWRTAEALRERFPWDNPREWHLAGSRLHRLEGWVRVESLPESRSDRSILACAVWQDSYEAEQHLLHMGLSEQPVCWTLCGWASGYLSCCHGRTIRFLEERCRGKGDAHCRVVGNPIEAWAPEMQEHLVFHEDCLEEALQKLVAELKASERLLRKRRSNIRQMNVDEEEPGVVARSEAMRRVLDLARRVATVDSTVVVLGESGVGKELVAHFIHDRSERSERPFVAVNCAAIPDDLLESELFGHIRGAFTGATQDRVGLLEAASSGTLFLDEIGEISPAMQVKLLRVLQDGQIRRLGENRNRPVNVRVIAATNRDLAEDVASGRFREDLYYRLRVIELEIPPLRTRREDILPLARLSIANLSTRMSRAIDGLTPAAADQLLRYDWPGNVRELENAMERGVVLTLGSRIGVEDLPEDVRNRFPEPVVADQVRSLDEIEQDYILAALDHNEGNRTKTAEQLGIGVATLYRRLRSYQRG